MEVTSEGIDQNRVLGINFNIKLLTNIVAVKPNSLVDSAKHLAIQQPRNVVFNSLLKVKSDRVIVNHDPCVVPDIAQAKGDFANALPGLSFWGQTPLYRAIVESINNGDLGKPQKGETLLTRY